MCPNYYFFQNAPSVLVTLKAQTFLHDHVLISYTCYDKLRSLIIDFFHVSFVCCLDCFSFSFRAPVCVLPIQFCRVAHFMTDKVNKMSQTLDQSPATFCLPFYEVKICQGKCKWNIIPDDTIVTRKLKPDSSSRWPNVIMLVQFKKPILDILLVLKKVS